MRKINRAFGVISLLLCLVSCTSSGEQSQASSTDDRFSFAFLTDVHMNLNNLSVSSEGLRQALEDAKSNDIDFVIFGGDLVDLDGLPPQDSLRADSLISAFKSIVDNSGVNAYYTIGNHDRYYIYASQPDEAGFGLFSDHLGKTFYSFDHKDVHFVVLNSVEINDSTHKYEVGPDQLEWLRADLSALSPQTPVVVSTHVPFQSLYYPAVEGVVKDVDMFSNFKEVWDILLGYNLQVILQGHQHLHEELLVNNTHFVTGGAVSAAWWGGPMLNTQEGYMLVNVDADKRFNWRYVDYEWEVSE